MANLFGILLGLSIGIGGFMLMRNPMTLSRLPYAPKGYYQHLILDAVQRNQLRALGGAISLFGITLAITASQFFAKSRVVEALFKTFYVLLSLVIMGGFVGGVLLVIFDLIRGRFLRRFLDSWKLLLHAPRLEALPVKPEVTPRMQKEAKIFTIAFCGMVCLGILTALARL
jgi:hypothetical protein